MVARARAPGPTSSRGSPVGISLLLVDGDNLLHASRGRRDEGGIAWLLPALSRWRPQGMHIVVALDGHPAPGEPSRGRATQGVDYVYAGARTADDLLVDVLSARPFTERAASAVVSGDVALAERARRAGGLARSVDWLLGQLATGAAMGQGRGVRAGGIGRGRHHAPGAGAARAPTDHPGGTPSGWRPGRGATRKTGNPRRAAKRADRG